LVVVVGLFGCSRSQTANSLRDSSSETITSASPPFQTREPERYRATRIITTIISPDSGSGNSKIRKITIARDGGNRREEYETESGETVIYLENNAGTFVLLPSSRIYANLNNSADIGVDVGAADEPSNSIDSILNRVSSEATYRKLGAEHLNERATTKYRVTYVSNGDSAASTQETFVWVDESLGMPIRSETSYINSGHSTRVVSELRDITLDVDSRLFDLPAGFKNVTHQVFLEQLRTRAGK
jgi:outer membrane lipoprotein-sorting protein